MPAEYEVKVLDIHPQAVEEKILQQGGHQLGGQRLMRRYVYDITPGDKSTWLRLRDDGYRAWLAVKEIVHDGIGGTYETETTVGSFEDTNQLLGKLGYKPKSYQENHRTSFSLDGARLEIDCWPRIPPYLEIEADTAAEVLKVAALLGFTENQLTTEDGFKVYARYGIDLATIPALRLGHPGVS